VPNVQIIISAVDLTGSAIATAEGKLTALAGATGAVGAAADRASGSTVTLGDKLGRIALGVLTAVAVMNGMTAALDATVGSATSFTDKLALIDSLTELTTPDVEALKGQLLDLAKKYPVSPTEAAAGAYFILSNGITSVNDAMTILEPVLKAHVIGMGDVDEIARVVVTSIAAWGLSAQDATPLLDMLTVAIQEGAAEADEYLGAISKVAPVAASLGVPFSEIAAFLSTASRAGADLDVVSTGLRQALLNLAAPSNETQEALAQLGISADDVRAAIRERGLAATLQWLIDLTGGNVEVLDKLFPNVRALTQVLAVAGSQGSEYGEILDKINNSQGALNEAYEVASDRLSVRFGTALNQVKVQLLEWSLVILPPLVDAFSWFIFTGWPAMKSAMESVAGVISDALKPSFEGLSDVVDALTPLAETLYRDAIRPLLDYLGEHKETIGKVAAFIGALGTAIALLMTPIGPAIAIVLAFGAAIAGIESIWPNVRGVLDEIVAFISGLPGQISGAVSSLGTLLAGIPGAVVGALTTAATQIAGFVTGLPILGPIVESAWTTIKTITDVWWGLITASVDTAINTVPTILSNAFVIIQQTWETSWDILSSFLSSLWTTIWTPIEIAFGVLQGMFEVNLALINGDWEGAWTAARDTVTRIFGEISSFFTSWWGTFQTAIQGTLTWVETSIPASWTIMQTAVEGIWGLLQTNFNIFWYGMSGIATTWLSTIETNISTVWNAINTTASTMWDTIKTTITTVWNGLITDGSNSFGTIESTISGIWNDINTAADTLWGDISTTLSRHWAEILAAFLVIFGPAGTIISAIIGLVTQVLPQNLGTVVGFFAGLPGQVETAVSSLPDALSRVFRGGMNAIIDAINGFIDTFNTLGIPPFHVSIPLAPDINFGGFNFPDIDRLATLRKGGFIPGGATVPAILHGPEAVIPLSSGVGPADDLLHALLERVFRPLEIALKKLEKVADDVVDGLDDINRAIGRMASKSLADGVEKVMSRVSDALVDFADMLSDRSKAVSDFVGGFKTNVGAILGNFDDLGASLRDFAGSLGDQVTSIGGQVHGIWDAFVGLSDALKVFSGSLEKWLPSTVGILLWAADGIGEAFASISSTFIGFVSSLSAAQVGMSGAAAGGGGLIVVFNHSGTLMGNEAEATKFADMIAVRIRERLKTAGVSGLFAP